MRQKLFNPIYTLLLMIALFLIRCSDEDLNNSSDNTGTLNDGLVAYFPLDSNYTDVSGNDNSLQAYGNPQFSEGCCNESSTAVSLDGEDDFLVSSIGKLDIFSISMWFQTDKEYTGWPAWRSFYFDYSNKQAYGYIDGSSGATSLLHCGTDSTAVVESNLNGSTDWFHIYMAVSNELKIYINGQLEETDTLQATMLYSGDSIFFGRASSDDDIEMTYFEGKLDEIRIYNRILNLDEIDELSGNDSN